MQAVTTGSLGSRAVRRQSLAGSQAAAGQKEMLMPIAGKRPAKEAAAKKPAARSRKSA